MKPVPVDNQRLDWPRLVANAINSLITLVERPQAEQVRYRDSKLQYYDGTDWQDVP